MRRGIPTASGFDHSLPQLAEARTREHEREEALWFEHGSAHLEEEHILGVPHLAEEARAVEAVCGPRRAPVASPPLLAQLERQQLQPKRMLDEPPRARMGELRQQADPTAARLALPLRLPTRVRNPRLHERRERAVQRQLMRDELSKGALGSPLREEAAGSVRGARLRLSSLSSVRHSSVRLSSVGLGSVDLSSVRHSSVRLSSIPLSSVRLLARCVLEPRIQLGPDGANA